ncbi:hypothetical protein BDM02DRAFT_3261162 [Thelephora ganbajun]|uniref:Uncharacterized protein n=1 Tax=Thelephora ganbajun TaxID=370292 RepID=A0ACB6ZF72_THEGA|nr:hypothetical protein BDM02DRAFT_3261162 [Thelephora ganbajun]
MRPSPLAHTATLLIVFLLVIHSPYVDAVNLQACGTRLQEQQNEVQSTTHTTESPPLLDVSYEQCLVECGTGMGDVDLFNFSAWLLFTLVSQIPFAEHPWDDLVSFFIAMGSPALAAYSLQITHLNARFIATAFLDVKYPNSKLIPIVLTAFHHVPVRLSHRPPFLHSLIVLPQNDEFWSHLLAAANKTRRWSTQVVTSYGWVILSVVMTLIDFISSRPGDIVYSVAAIWTFILPLIMCLLQVWCEPEPSHLRNSLDAANLKAWVATERRDQPVKSPLAIESMKAEDVDLARKDELKPVHVFNYSRAFITPLTAELILGLMKNAATNAEQKIPVGSPTGRVPAWVEAEGGKIHPENRVGTDTEVTEYCTRVLPQLKQNSDSATQLEIQSPEMTKTTDPLLPLHDPRPVTPSRWASGTWKRVAIASALALGLQWGTVGAAVMAHYVAPPRGLGCRAFSFLLYGVAGTLSFFLFLASSILAHMSRPLQGQIYTRSWLHTCQNTGAIVCRRLGKCVAIASAVGILLVCFFQVTGAFNNCFCSSITFDKGKHSVAGPSTLRNWIGGLMVAFSTTILFGFSMYLGLPPRR